VFKPTARLTMKATASASVSRVVLLVAARGSATHPLIDVERLTAMILPSE
jgi:hypothetical protein